MSAVEDVPVEGRGGPRVRRRRPSLLAAMGYCLVRALVGGTLALVGALALAVLVVGGALMILRDVDPPGSMLMLRQWLAGEQVVQRWVRLAEISPNLVQAIIVSEDGRFCDHKGVDLTELEAAIEQAERRGDGNVRGASTITMQVAKNLFLWSSRSYLRKGIEIPLALAIELAWSKPRILEVYLNIAEWGQGVFGAEAAARYHFGKTVRRLTTSEAALLAVALPNPFERDAGEPGPGTRRLASTIEARLRQIGRRADCVLAAQPVAGARRR
jgi:monofunctional biosynthetic peptidoglycan transglycosylase